MTKLRPETHDPLTGGFFDAAREGRLTVQRCGTCGEHQHPPRPRCISCSGTTLEWADVPHRGTVHSWTVVEHQIHPAFPTPFTVVLVDVVPQWSDDAVRFVGRLPGRPMLEAGDDVQVVFSDMGDGVVLPDWSLVDGPDDR